jgi:mRNA-degrading endonuclease RelE of RelBE toxin-antitoxin system
MAAIRFIPPVKKDLKGLPHGLLEQLHTVHFPRLAAEPTRGDTLSGPFKGLRSYHFSFHATEYRIIYEVVLDEPLVMVLMIGPRERLYERLRQRLR